MAEERITVAYVQAPDKAPLMPCHSYGRVKRWLKLGRARIVSTHPFTVRLNYEPETRITQRVLLGPDPGRYNVGLTAILEDGGVLYAANAETRNGEVKQNMRKRAQYRGLRRQYRREIRKRFARRNGNTFQMKFGPTGMGMRPHAILKKRKDYPLRDLVQDRYHNRTTDVFQFVWMRILPSYQKPAILHDITNTEARFSNRNREKGWLTPTANQLLQTMINLVRLVMKILPVTDVVIELNRFDIAGMDHPDWEGQDYCHGPLHGYEGRNRKEKLHAAVDGLQNGHCIFCRKKIEHYHHITPVSRGGRDVVANTAGLCAGHHDQVHKNHAMFEELKKRKECLNKKNGLLSVINQVMPYLIEELEKIPGVQVHYTYGWETKEIRERFGLPKDHYIDAWCIAASALDPSKVQVPVFPERTLFHIMQFRRHDRACTLRLGNRKYLNGDGKTVAVNRKKATVAVPKADGTLGEKKQTNDSLAEYREKLVAQYLENIQNPTEADYMAALREAEKEISGLKVSKGHAVYNRMGRVLPGATFRVKETGELFVMQGQQHRGEYLLQAYSGVKTLKNRISRLKKQIRGLEKKGGGGTAPLKAEAEKLQKCLPEDKAVSIKNLELVKRNSGLVYIPSHIQYPA